MLIILLETLRLYNSGCVDNFVHSSSVRNILSLLVKMVFINYRMLTISSGNSIV